VRTLSSFLHDLPLSLPLNAPSSPFVGQSPFRVVLALLFTFAHHYHYTLTSLTLLSLLATPPRFHIAETLSTALLFPQRLLIRGSTSNPRTPPRSEYCSVFPGYQAVQEPHFQHSLFLGTKSALTFYNHLTIGQSSGTQCSRSPWADDNNPICQE